MGGGKIESKHHILSLKLFAFETMGQVTTICTNKIGILTKNEKKVIEFQLGKPIKKKKKEFQLGKDAVKDYTSLDMVGDLLKLLQAAVGLNKIGTVHITSCILHHDLHRLKTQKSRTLFLLKPMSNSTSCLPQG